MAADLHAEGQLSIDGTATKKVTECSVPVANGANLRQALNNDQATGIAFGPIECTFSLTSEVPEQGAEYNMIAAVVRRERGSWRFKDSGDRFTVEGALSDAEWRTSKADGVVTLTGNGVGILKLT
jgi:hypothetical protein